MNIDIDDNKIKKPTKIEENKLWRSPGSSNGSKAPDVSDKFVSKNPFCGFQQVRARFAFSQLHIRMRGVANMEQSQMHQSSLSFIVILYFQYGMVKNTLVILRNHYCIISQNMNCLGCCFLYELKCLEIFSNKCFVSSY